MTYIFLSLKIRHGEYEFYSPSVHEFEDKRDVNAFSDAYAEHYYNGPSEYEDGGYYFNGGEVHVSVYQAQYIDEDDYEVLNKFI